MKTLTVQESLNLLLKFIIKKIKFDKFEFEEANNDIEINLVNNKNIEKKYLLSDFLLDLEIKAIILNEIFKHDTFYWTTKNKVRWENLYVENVKFICENENYSDLKYFLSELVHKMKLNKDS